MTRVLVSPSLTLYCSSAACPGRWQTTISLDGDPFVGDPSHVMHRRAAEAGWSIGRGPHDAWCPLHWRANTEDPGPKCQFGNAHGHVYTFSAVPSACGHPRQGIRAAKNRAPIDADHLLWLPCPTDTCQDRDGYRGEKLSLPDDMLTLWASSGLLFDYPISIRRMTDGATWLWTI